MAYLFNKVFLSPLQRCVERVLDISFCEENKKRLKRGYFSVYMLRFCRANAGWNAT
jgi:hypothetical protein